MIHIGGKAACLWKRTGRGMRSTCHVVIGFHLTRRQVNLDGPGGLCPRASLTKELEIRNGACRCS